MGSWFSSSAVPNPPQTSHIDLETDWVCPICRDAREDVSYLTPCLHKFCLGCIMRSAKRQTSCPLCRHRIFTIIYSVRSEEDFLEIFVQKPSDQSVADHQVTQGAVEPVPRAYVAGFPPEVWAGLFRDSSEFREPLLPWLNQELSVLCRARWWEVAAAQGIIVLNLCRHGLDQEALVRALQPLLQDQTVTFVRRFITVAADLCSEVIQRHMDLPGSRAAEEQDRPTATPGPAASLGGTPAPNPRAQKEPHEDLRQAVTGPSTPGQNRRDSPGNPRRPLKRRAGSSQGSSSRKRPRY